MRSFLRRPFCWAILSGTVLVLFTAYILLEAFVIPQVLSPSGTEDDATRDTVAKTTATAVTGKTTVSTSGTAAAFAAVDTGWEELGGKYTDGYTDTHLSVQLYTFRQYDTQIYAADVQMADIASFKAAFANNTYGRNIKQTTSAMATANQAVLAVNGDYYGFRNGGYVLRNGKLYRETKQSNTQQDLVIGTDGRFRFVNESTTDVLTAATDAWQIFSFGPVLLQNNRVQVDTTQEVAQSMRSNPRTAVGMIAPLHYVFLVSDGRTADSQGLSLYQLAEMLRTLGCTDAYNLDGGGSSTMWFRGRVINQPTDGTKTGERQVSDIVYIG